MGGWGGGGNYVEIFIIEVIELFFFWVSTAPGSAVDVLIGYLTI